MKKYWNKRLWVVGVLLIVAIAPLVLQRPEAVSRSKADEVLVVMTPHNETIRSEFGVAFNRYWKQKTGKSVYIDWRTPGGSSEIRMVLDRKFDAATEGEGVGLDVFFGGGEFIYEKMAQAGRFEKLEVFTKQSQWFEGEHGIPKQYTGEAFYDDEQYWVGVCVAQFGICYNVDGLKRIGVDPPASWDDLGDPKYFGKIALADPTKSGSVARAFEMLVQQKIQLALARTKREPGETESMRRLRSIRIGWAEGLNLIQKIAANARYFTDSAAKIPHDVAQGDAVAGMCIDFYGRTYHEKLKKADGSSRLQWVAPSGGTSIGVDPVAVFREAPNKTLAQGFVEFLLTEEGQVLWNKKVGTENGPECRSLRRLPIRPAVYTAKNLKDFSDPIDPFKEAPLFVYQGDITGPVFDSLRTIIKSMCIDAHSELQEAWASLARSGFPKRAGEHFHDVSYASYDKARGEIQGQLRSESKLEVVEMSKRMTGVFRRLYSETRDLEVEVSNEK
ncbi:ABC transporter substrate-binding protein [Rubritalea spongiae]|uniref:ABC transporter substrate-binding protein n=1 Tax=Rubritalea spongiae TaxID=430797 RepID=A0ABW5E1Q2_9BACT